MQQKYKDHDQIDGLNEYAAKARIPSVGIEEAIPLVIYNEEKKRFELNEEGRVHLEKLDAPLGVVAVAGNYRTGKSYLLNRMLLDRNEGGFGVGPTINPCTKGVWMWGQPIKGMTPDGDPINVLILDTEGLGALDEDSNHDVRIFSLAILLSSFFLYNSVGSIDENALQNLSLVINLTKHIQIKNSGIKEDVDPDEFAKYFPSFMWVVRDFTLQLVDQEGEPMTSKDYLEKALSNQKGFSDSIEQKNRIRRLLKSFFVERDCVTMIRPLTDESALQTLSTKPMNTLRPEFVEQVVNLRRKVLQRVKPKKINGKPLNGTMFFNLVKSYVEAINQGAIPSIESSWAYICKNECQKALEQAFDIFQKDLNKEMRDGGPFEEQELKDTYKTCKKKALDYFQKIAVGDVKEEFYENLAPKMKSRYELLRQDNDHSCEQECLMFLRQSYTEIERALKNQQYPSYFDYLSDIEQLKQIFDESGPPGAKRNEIMLDFMMKAVVESAEFFMTSFQNEFNIAKQIMEEQVNKYKQEIAEYKSETKVKLEQMENRQRKTDIERAELAAKEQSTREALKQLESEKKELETNLTSKLTQLKKDHQREMDELQQKFLIAEEQRKDIQRTQVQAESEFDKQKALLDDKINYLENALEENSKREKELQTELKNCKREFINQNKENQLVLEKQIKEQLKNIEELKEQLYEQENKNTTLEFQMEELKNSLEVQNKQLNKELKSLKDQDSDTNKKYEALKKKYDNDLKNIESIRENEKALHDQRSQEVEQSLKETQEQFDVAKQSWDKEKAVLNQKLEFIKYQLDDQKQKFEESRQAHDSMLHSLQSTNRESVIGREEAQNKINQMEEEFVKERKRQEDMYNEYRKKLIDQVEQLKKKNNELELERKLIEGDFQKEVHTLKEQLAESEAKRDEAMNSLKNLDSKSLSKMREKEDDFKKREQELEHQLEEKEQEIDVLIQEHNEKSEKQLFELKRFYEDEKERLERRIQEDKARHEKKMHNTVEEYEDKIQELTNNHDEAYNALEDEKNAMESDMNNILNQLEKENQVMQQQIENKEKYINELKDNLANLQNQTQKNSEMQTERFNRERKELNERIETITMQLSGKDRQILSLENAKDSMNQQLLGKDKAHEEMKNEMLQEKIALQQKIEELKQKWDNTMDELTQSRINQEREKALKDQKISFQDQRIKEYNEQQKEVIERYEERLKQEKDDAAKTLTDRIARIQQEKENVDIKYEQKRKAYKELEKQMQITQAQFERDRAVQIEKYENLEKSQNDLIKTYEAENMKLQEQNNQLNEALSNGDIGIREQVEHWKGQFYDMERNHADLQSELEKEKALWEGKFEFLEKQKDQAKKDNEEALKQFQTTVDQLQKSQNENKQKHEHNQSIYIQNMEQKHGMKIRDLEEQAKNRENSLQQTIRKLEKDNKALNERLELANKSMMSEAGGLEKKLERIQDERDRLKEDIEKIRLENEKKLEELKRQVEREKETLKQKNETLNQKNKATEAKQTEIILSHETNRAKWDQEKSFLVSAKEEAVSEFRAIQKKYENAVKEIERLKEQQKRNNWKNNKPERIGAGGLTTNNPVMLKMGEGMLGRLNLGGAGAGLNKPANEVSQSISNLNLGKIGEMGSYRQTIGVDKSIDNFKLGFSDRFGSQLGGLKFGQHADNKSTAGGETGRLILGAVKDPQSLNQAMQQNNHNLEHSMRGSNILSTPSSKGKLDEQDFEK